ncbi:MAG: hypothetical protein ACLFTT_06280 [Candidatus Hydrogenedentota bacterium]
MTLPNMPAQMTSREFLRIAGGYGTPGAGHSPAGGLDVDNAGNLAMDGDLTVGGALRMAAGGVDKTWSCWLDVATALRGTSNPPAGPNVTWNNDYRGNFHSLDFDASNKEFVSWVLALPAHYDGSALRVDLVWTASAGTVGLEVAWQPRLAVLADGENPDQSMAPIAYVVDAYQGAGLVHVSTGSGVPLVPGGGSVLFVTLNRAADADTFDADAKLIGLRLGYA